MTGWPQLPTELRYMIFDYLEPGYEWPAASYQRAHCATVCKEWQLQFEYQNFRVLAIDQDRLQDFVDIVSCNERRRRIVRKITLRVKLDEYDCSVCESEEDASTVKRNDEVFFETIWTSLHILSTWEKRGGIQKPDSLVLDLGVYSPSDGEHAFRELRFTKGYSCIPGYFKCDKELGAEYERHVESLLESSDNCPGWANTRLGEPSIQAKKRVLSTIGDPRSAHARNAIKCCDTKFGELPKAEAVTALRIRRHYFRHISPLILRRILEQSLTNIRQFRHEKWRGYSLLISKSLPKTLRSLFLFEDYNKPIHPNGASASERKPSRALGRALAKGRELTKLTASFHVDAKDFFPIIWPNVGNWREEVQKARHYPKLEHLALTAAVSPRRGFHSRLGRLLVAAGVAALYHMPKLKIMELWDYMREGDRGYDWAFRFESGSQLQITFMATFDVESHYFEPMFEAWKWMVKDTHPGQVLHIKTERWKWHQGYRKPLNTLKLKDEVVNRVSLHQIFYEGRSTGW